MALADLAGSSQCSQNINRVEKVAKDDVIKGLIELQILWIRSYKMKLGIISLSNLHQPFADFDANSVRRLDRGQQVSGLTTNFQHTLGRLDDETEQALKPVVKIPIRVHPAVTFIGKLALPAPPGLPTSSKSIGTPHRRGLGWGLLLHPTLHGAQVLGH